MGNFYFFSIPCSKSCLSFPLLFYCAMSYSHLSNQPGTQQKCFCGYDCTLNYALHTHKTLHLLKFLNIHRRTMPITYMLGCLGLHLKAYSKVCHSICHFNRSFLFIKIFFWKICWVGFIGWWVLIVGFALLNTEVLGAVKYDSSQCSKFFTGVSLPSLHPALARVHRVVASWTCDYSHIWI